MTVTYSLDVANTRFCGFSKLLWRWKGSIYKILWRELLLFSFGYSILSVTYRCFLTETQKRRFEDVVLYCETFIELIPLSFVLGFYVSLVVGRWWNQFDAIPWPDRTCLLIGTVVHGSDERSRTIRRTLGRYLILLQMFTFQAVSTAFKKRFPTVRHFEEAGLMTKEERTIYEQVDIPYGKWWLPAHWFCALAMRARKEGRIKDSILLETLIKEMINYRSTCGTMMNYDWISVPLVYTQVVTIATYTYSVALIIGRQYLDPSRGLKNHQVDLYVPIFTLLQFFFYVGWLKVAEQIVNPYGEDDDDFELNWCLDRNSQIVYMLVDHLHAKHPKLRRDVYWEQLEPQIPHTKFTVKNLINPQLGSTAHLDIDPSKTDFVSNDALLEEEDNENYMYDSVKRSGVRYRPSVLMSLFNSGLGQSLRRKSTRKGDSFRTPSVKQGHFNPTFVLDGIPPGKSTTPTSSRKSSLAGAKPASPTISRASSTSFKKGSIISRHRQKSYDVHHAEADNFQPELPDVEMRIPNSEIKTTNYEEDECDKDSGPQQKPIEVVVPHMPPIPEEPSRPPSMHSLIADKVKDTDSVQDLVAEASKVIEELNRVVKEQSHRKDCELVGYESCCSLSSDESSREDNVVSPSDETVLTDLPYDELSITIDRHEDQFQDMFLPNNSSEML